MAFYDFSDDEYRSDFRSLFAHLKRIANKNDVMPEVIIRDLTMENLRDYQ